MGVIVNSPDIDSDDDIASWAGVTRAAGFDAFAATPSSANLRALVTDESGSGALLFANGALGTPSSGVLTNATGLPISTGVAGLGTGVATALAVNVGSAGAPVVNGGALGTPSSGTLTNATGLPVATGISGLGATWTTALGATYSGPFYGVWYGMDAGLADNATAYGNLHTAGAQKELRIGEGEFDFGSQPSRLSGNTTLQGEGWWQTYLVANYATSTNRFFQLGTVDKLADIHLRRGSGQTANEGIALQLTSDDSVLCDWTTVSGVMVDGDSTTWNTGCLIDGSDRSGGLGARDVFLFHPIIFDCSTYCLRGKTVINFSLYGGLFFDGDGTDTLVYFHGDSGEPSQRLNLNASIAGKLTFADYVSVFCFTGNIDEAITIGANCTYGVIVAGGNNTVSNSSASTSVITPMVWQAAGTLTVTGNGRFNAGLGVNIAPAASKMAHVMTDSSAATAYRGQRFAGGYYFDLIMSTDGTGEHLLVNVHNGSSAVDVARFYQAAFAPASDNTKTLGLSGARWSVVYAATGTIDTSDETQKTKFGTIPDGVKRAMRKLMGSIGVYQWLDAVAEKGPDGARYHIGLGAQTVMKAFEDEGENPFRWALFCADPETEEVEVRVCKPITRQKMKRVPKDRIEIRDGVAVLVEDFDVIPEVEIMPVFREDGTPAVVREPVIDHIKEGGQTIQRARLGEDGLPVFKERQMEHAAPVMEAVDEEIVTVERRAIYDNVTGLPKMRFGLRYEQIAMLAVAVLAEGSA